MQKIKKFFKTTMLGGVVVLLPVFLTIFFLKWLFNFITHLLNPVTKLICREAAIQQRLADLLVITIIIIICFFVGLIIKTRAGIYIHRQIENWILKIVPSYNLFRNTIKQFFGQEKNPFSRVVLVQAFGSESSSLMTGFITDEQPTDDGRYTVFLPSALNPTTGLILHVEKKYVQIIPVSVETAMRSIISCGAGSAELLDMAPNILSK
jgi:uncharacterized membrane protein